MSINLSLFTVPALLVIFSAVMYFAESQFRKKKAWAYPYDFVLSLYFLGLSSVVLFLFFYVGTVYTWLNYLPLTFCFVASIYAVSVGLYHVAKKYLVAPRDFMLEKPFYVWLKLEDSYIPSKLSNIFFQQTVIVALVLRIYEYFPEIWLLSLFFGLVFGAVHLGMFLYESRKWALYYIVPSFFSGAIFPYLLLSTKYGFLYTLLIHWGFYLFSGLGVWAIYTIRSRRVVKIG